MLHSLQVLLLQFRTSPSPLYCTTEQHVPTLTIRNDLVATAVVQISELSPKRQRRSLQKPRVGTSTTASMMTRQGEEAGAEAEVGGTLRAAEEEAAETEAVAAHVAEIQTEEADGVGADCGSQRYRPLRVLGKPVCWE